MKNLDQNAVKQILLRDDNKWYDDMVQEKMPTTCPIIVYHDKTCWDFD